MNKCDSCGQTKPLEDGEILATHIDAYRAAFGMLKELWRKEPPEWQTLRTARFLAGEDAQMSDSVLPGEDEDD